jgi:hypothetical protein
MKINRGNYEEYFLLYTDDELSADLRKELESFVQQNPDLREELEVLQSLKIQPELDIELDNKDFLLKGINTINADMEASMLLHLDHELDATKAGSLETAIASDENLRKEWELLLKTRLQTEAVVFEQKEVLYRKETEVVPMFKMQWTRYAAAAAVVLIAGLLWMNRGEQVQPGPGAEIAQQVDQSKKNKKSDPSVTSPAQVDARQQKTTAEETGAAVERMATSDLITEKENGSPLSATPLATATRTQKGLTEKKVMLEEPGKNENVRMADEPLVAKNLNNTPPKPPAIEITDQAVGSAEPEIRADYATRALMNQTEDEPMQMEASQGSRKGPLRGIVRKANRIFHKVTNPDLDKTLVKVSSFEIALPN